MYTCKVEIKDSASPSHILCMDVNETEKISLEKSLMKSILPTAIYRTARKTPGHWFVLQSFQGVSVEAFNSSIANSIGFMQEHLL